MVRFKTGQTRGDGEGGTLRFAIRFPLVPPNEDISVVPSPPGIEELHRRSDEFSLHLINMA